jgi:hypothetical protein
MLGQAVLGTRSGFKWLDRVSVPLESRERRNARQEAAYDDFVAGRYVTEMLRDALERAR